MAVAGTVDDHSRPMTREERKVIIASSLGTIFEWYDFYLAGSLAAIIAREVLQPGVNPTAAFIFACWALRRASRCVPSARCSSAAWAI
jgi:hypothetical protein